jgi:hypothetical protein
MSDQTTVKTLTAVTANNNAEATGKEENPITEALKQGVKEASMLTPEAFSSALEEVLDVIQAIGPDQIRRLGISVPQAVAVARHYAKCYAEDRAAFVRTLNPCVFDPEDHDNMETRATALWEADVMLGKILENNSDLSKIADEARRAKYRLVRTAEYLWGEDQEKMEDVANMIGVKTHHLLYNIDEGQNKIAR